ncbi:MAG TPA: hypothetical protein P5307_13090 [Pirellulaceae bacterium]|nr:hypothetical protein [Pirellulaceae bacterium]
MFLATQQERHTGSDGEPGQNRPGLDRAYVDERQHTRGDQPDGEQEHPYVFGPNPIHRFIPSV